MALRGKPAGTPAFEGMEDNAPVEGEVVNRTIEPAPAEEAAPAAAEVQAEAPAAEVKPAEPKVAAEEVKANPVAAVKNTSVVMGGKYKPALTEVENAIDPSGIDFDTFPRVTVGLDGFSDEHGTVMGKKIKLMILSFNERYLVTAGEDNDEANKKVKFSLDGVHIDGEDMLVADYVKYLKDVEHYEDAERKKYNTIYGFIVATAETEKSPFEVVPEDERRLVALQVPPRSVAKFMGYRTEQGIKEAMGVAQPTNEVVLTQVKMKGTKKDYASIVFSAK